MVPYWYQYKALQYQELSKGTSLVSQLVQRFSPDDPLISDPCHTNALDQNNTVKLIKSNLLQHNWNKITSLLGKFKHNKKRKIQCFLALKRQNIWQTICTQWQIKTESHLEQVQTRKTQPDCRDGQKQKNMAATGREVVSTLWSKQNWDRAALSDRMHQILTNSGKVISQNKTHTSEFRVSFKWWETAHLIGGFSDAAITYEGQWLIWLQSHSSTIYYCSFIFYYYKYFYLL